MDVAGDRLWWIVKRWDPEKLQVAFCYETLDLRTGARTTCQTPPLQNRLAYARRRVNQPPPDELAAVELTSDPSLGGEGICVATSEGLALFDPARTEADVLRPQDLGLPGTFTAGFELGGVRYLACSEEANGFIFRCRPGQPPEMLAGSSRKEKKSSLDDCAGFMVHQFCLLPYAPDRLHMFVMRQQRLPWETYALDIDTGAITGRLSTVAMRNGSDRNFVNMPVMPSFADGYGLSPLRPCGRYGFWSGTGIVTPRLDAVWSVFGIAKDRDHVENPLFRTSKHSWSDMRGDHWTSAIMGNRLYIHANDKEWRVFERWMGGDSRGPIAYRTLPLLGDVAPRFLATWNGTLLAGTEQDIWHLRPKREFGGPDLIHKDWSDALFESAAKEK